MRRSAGRIKRLDLSEMGVSSRFKEAELWKELSRRLCCSSGFSLPSLEGLFASTGEPVVGTSTSKDCGFWTSAGGFGGAKGVASATLRIVVVAITEDCGREACASGGDDTSTGGRGLDS